MSKYRYFKVDLGVLDFEEMVERFYRCSGEVYCEFPLRWNRDFIEWYSDIAGDWERYERWKEVGESIEEEIL